MKLTRSEYKQHLDGVCSEAEQEQILGKLYPGDNQQNKLEENNETRK
jgi:hypothetical protein